MEYHVTLENTNAKTAFFIQLNISDEKQNTLFPVFWDDNYISLLPNEKKVIKCTVPSRLITQNGTRLTISGWNTKEEILSLNKK
jgi:exo-1,4-beta-D-glucosaminidase